MGESERDEEEEKRYVEPFQQLRIGGIIVSPVSSRLEHLARARAEGTPVVVMARQWGDGDSVSADDIEGGQLAAQHLLARGHRRTGALIEHGVEAANRLLELRKRPTAVFVISDRKAIGVVHRLLGRGLRVPEDMAVIGYDDIPYAACAQVPLTTVAVPKRPLGEMSAELLFDRFDRPIPPEPRQVLLPPELVIRASCP